MRSRLDALDIKAYRHRAETDFRSWLPLVDEVDRLRDEVAVLEETLASATGRTFDPERLATAAKRLTGVSISEIVRQALEEWVK